MRLYRKKDNSGSILAMVLWVLAGLAIFSLSVARVTGALSYYTEWKMRKVSAYYMFHNIIEMKKIELSKGYLKDGEIGITNELYELEDDKGLRAEYTVYDEEAKLNINYIPASIIEELPGLSSRDAIKIKEYELKPLVVLEEITIALDNTDALDIEAFRSILTVYGRGKVNLNNAGAEVLEIMGLHDSLINGIIEMRLGPDGKRGTQDDIVFGEGESIIDVLKDYAGLSIGDEVDMMKLISKGLLGTGSEHYRINASIYKSKKQIDTYTAVIGIDKNKKFPVVLEWRRL